MVTYIKWFSSADRQFPSFSWIPQRLSTLWCLSQGKLKPRPCVKHLTHIGVWGCLSSVSLIRWSAFYLLLTECWECPMSTLLSLKHRTKKLVDSGITVYYNNNNSKSQGHTDWLHVPWCAVMSLHPMWSYFHQLPAVSILWCRLPSGQLESQCTSVELTCENSQLCRCLCHWPKVSAEPYPHCSWKDWVSNVQKFPDLFYSPKCSMNWVCRQLWVNSPNNQHQKE